MQTSPYNRFFSFFGLRENPFAVSPDPRYLFMTGQMQEAWDTLAYGIQSREGIVLLTGEAGTGKTTLMNRLLEWLYERRMPTAFIFNSHLEPKHLFDFMLSDFGVPPDPRWHNNALLSLSRWLPERCLEGRIPVLIVDEAQGLPLHVLEEIRMLMNLENSHEKLLQIVLAGQPELEEKLKRPEMRHLAQRISVRCKTGALSLKETFDFIQARLSVAGATGKPIFSPEAVRAVHDCSRGIPRVMNLLCEHALINAYAANMRVVPARVVNEVAREFQFDPQVSAPSIQSGALPPRVYEPIFPDAVVPPPAMVDLASFASASQFAETPPFVETPLIAEALPSAVTPAPVAAPALVVSTMDTVVARVFSAPAEEAIPEYAACEQPAIVMAERSDVVVAPRQPEISPLTFALQPSLQSATRTTTPAPTATQTAAPTATAARRSMPRPLVGAASTKTVLKRRVVKAFAASRDVIAESLATVVSLVVSWMVRARLSERSRKYQRELRRSWRRNIERFDRKVVPQLEALVNSGLAFGAKRLSATRASAARSLQLLWRNSEPVWLNAKRFLLNWLSRPLAWPVSSTAREAGSRATLLWAKVTNSLKLARPWQRVSEAARPARVASNQVSQASQLRRRSAPVRRWLREPFRPSDLVRSSSRAAGQRSRASSAL